MGRVLPEYVELPLESLLVPAALLTLLSVSVVFPENDERLKDKRLLRKRAGSEDAAVAWNLSPSEDPESESVGDVGEGGLDLGVEDLVGLMEKDVSDGVVVRGGELSGHAVGRLSDEELVGDAGHDSSPVSVSSVGSG